jgi:hypothetical protein
MPRGRAAEEKSRPAARFDVWLSRFTAFAQIGLFALTAWGLYFTVIPLYQNALLNEAIARKELELKEVSAKEEELYAEVRKRIVSQLLLRIGTECTGLLEPSSFGKKILPEIPKSLSIDVSECIQSSVSQSRYLGDLREVDRNGVEASIGVLGKEVQTLQLKARADYESFERRVAADYSLLLPIAEGTASFELARVLRLQYGDSDPQRYEESVRSLQIAAGKQAIVSSYIENVRLRVASVLETN